MDRLPNGGRLRLNPLCVTCRARESRPVARSGRRRRGLHCDPCVSPGATDDLRSRRRDRRSSRRRGPQPVQPKATAARTSTVGTKMVPAVAARRWTPVRALWMTHRCSEIKWIPTRKLYIRIHPPASMVKHKHEYRGVEVIGPVIALAAEWKTAMSEPQARSCYSPAVQRSPPRRPAISRGDSQPSPSG